jgi:acyl-CoA dehydrogenase
VVTLAVAAEAVGSSEACLWEAVGYAKTRVQFGREIGGFQAIKHALADVAVELDDARSALEHAMWAATADPDSLPLASSIAAAAATAAHLHASAENIQVHGGIGFTWEHSAHLHFRRARSNAALFGEVRHHHEDVLRALGV